MYSYGETAWNSTEIDAEIALQDSLLNGTMSPLPHLSLNRKILVSLSWVFPFSSTLSAWPHPPLSDPTSSKFKFRAWGPPFPQSVFSLLRCPFPALSPTLPRSTPPFSGHPQPILTHDSMLQMWLIEPDALLRLPRVQKTELSFFLCSFSFIPILSLTHSMHTQIHTHTNTQIFLLYLWVFYHQEGENGLLRPDRLLLHHITQPAIPFVCCDSFVFFFRVIVSVRSWQVCCNI